MRAKLCIVLLVLLGSGGRNSVHAADLRGYHKKVSVSAPTRIVWTFAVATQSLATPPADWLGDYDSKKQSYELFVPPNYNPKQTYPVILFISSGAEPMG